MQATQSNHAPDFLEADSFGSRPGSSFDSRSAEGDPKNARTRDVPSPFSAPIQAARKYLERQRSSTSQGQREKAAVAEPGGGLNGGPATKFAREQTSREQAGRNEANLEQADREQASRDQDRRLERSLYEGHSIEAALHFGELNDLAGGERSHLADSNLREPLFSYADPYPGACPPPDADAVRGAIFRLARESGAGQERPIQGVAAGPSDGRMPHNSHEEQPTAFADVARRLWAGERVENRDSRIASSTELPSLNDDEAKCPGAMDCSVPAAQGIDAEFIEAAQMAEIESMPVEKPSMLIHGGVLPTTALPPAEPILITTVPNGPAHHPLIAEGTPHAAQPERAARREVHPHSTGLMGRESLLSAVEGEFEVSQRHSDNTFKDAALAHDACNLLSALRLYSDLLNFPGVLAEQHRHYVEELKLIAGRSQVLIDRLLKLGEAAQTVKNGTTLAAKEGAAAPERKSPKGSHLLDVVEEVAQMHFDSQSNLPMQREAEEVIVPRAPTPARQTKIHVTPKPAEVSAATAQAEDPPETSLVPLIMRWGSLLSTLAHGTLDVSFGPDAATPVPLAAEPLERILVNLVRNARAATIAGGAIRINVEARAEEQAAAEVLEALPGTASRSLSNSSQSIILTVDDSGCGMTPAQVDRILGVETGPGSPPSGSAEVPAVVEGYGRWPLHDGGHRQGQAVVDADPVGEAVRGGLGFGGLSRGELAGRRGLGLQVVKELVRASGGMLAIHSRLSKGTRIEIRWPVPASAIATARPTEAVGHERAGDAATEPTFQSALSAGQRPIVAPAPRPTIGPDGFSEAELRAMMLRMHRSGPAEAGQQKRTADRPAAGALSPTETNNEAASYSALKGAIAC